MIDLQPDKQTWWRSARSTILALLRWSPDLSPETYRLVKLGAICAFAVDLGLLIAVHYHWLGAGWSTVRRVEDAGAMLLMGLWISQVMRSHRTKREGLR